ncbi:MAG: hypothetical protein WKF84_24545 [Pyrinomonadaceae bacterium]
MSWTQTPPVPAQIQAWGLGQDESSVLAWAHAHPGTEAIVDDLAARRCAAAFNIPVRGLWDWCSSQNSAGIFRRRAPSSYI